jgi:hypothetical protein
LSSSKRLVLARCSIDYAGRLSAHLALATRVREGLADFRVATARVPLAGEQNEEVVPVNESTWVLLSGVTVGR